MRCKYFLTEMMQNTRKKDKILVNINKSLDMKQECPPTMSFSDWSSSQDYQYISKTDKKNLGLVSATYY